MRDDVLEVKRRPLQRLVHPAVFTSLRGRLLNLAFELTPRDHSDFRPSKCNDFARTNESRSLSSTKDSRSTRSTSVNSPSLFRSISSCRRWSILGVKYRSPTVSNHSSGAPIALRTTFSPSDQLGVSVCCPSKHSVYVPIPNIFQPPLKFSFSDLANSGACVHPECDKRQSPPNVKSRNKSTAQLRRADREYIMAP